MLGYVCAHCYCTIALFIGLISVYKASGSLAATKFGVKVHLLFNSVGH